MSARLVTAVLWSLGVAWLGFITWRKTGTVSLSLGVVTLLVTLPTFYFFTSFVSPHSLNPLILAAAIVIADRTLRKGSTDFSRTQERWVGGALRSWISNVWIYIFLGFSAVVALSVPQALATVGVAALYMIISSIVSDWRSRPSWLLSYGALMALTAVVAAGIFYGLFRFWQWQKDFRAIPAAAEVDPDRANVDPADPVYESPLERVISLWGTFWPNSLDSGVPAGPDVTAVIAPWALVVTSLSVAALILWRKQSWLGPMMLTLYIGAPAFAILNDVVFTTEVQSRYGLVFPIIGMLSFATAAIPKWPRRILLIALLITYVSMFVLNYMFVEARLCSLNPLTGLISCPGS